MLPFHVRWQVVINILEICDRWNAWNVHFITALVEQVLIPVLKPHCRIKVSSEVVFSGMLMSRRINDCFTNWQNTCKADCFLLQFIVQTCKTATKLLNLSKLPIPASKLSDADRIA